MSSKRPKTLTQNLFGQTADLVEGLDEWGYQERDLAWKQLKAYRKVPVQRIVRQHYADLAGAGEAAFGQFHKTYVEEIREAVESVRKAVTYVLDQEENSLRARRGHRAALPPETQVGFNRAINRLRDLRDPGRRSLGRLGVESRRRTHGTTATGPGRPQTLRWLGVLFGTLRSVEPPPGRTRVRPFARWTEHYPFFPCGATQLQPMKKAIRPCALRSNGWAWSSSPPSK